MKIEEIKLSKIKENPYQTRETIEKEPLKVLVRSIQQRGLFNPISVLKDGEEYIIISGHRRFNAFKSLRRKAIPCIIKKRKSKNKLVVDLVHENLVREDLTPIEKALSIKLLFSEIKTTKGDIDRMIALLNSLKNYNKRGYTPKSKRKKETKGFEDDDIFKVDKILKNIGISINNAYTYLTILKLPTYIRNKIIYGRKGLEDKKGISVKKAEQLARITDKKYQEYVFERARENTTGKHIQALCDMFIQKIESGEWNGFEKTKNGYVVKNEDVEKLNILTKECINLSARISSFKVDTLLKLETTMEKEIFISSMVDLKRELERLRNNINVKLAQKGFREIKKNILPFNITLHKTNRGLFEKRFSFPVSIVKELNLSAEKDVKLKVKIVGIQENGD